MPVSPIETRMARLEGAYEQVSQRLMNIDPRFDGVDRKIDVLRDVLDKKIDTKIDALDTKIAQYFMWTIGIVLTACLTSTGATITAIFLHH